LLQSYGLDAKNIKGFSLSGRAGAGVFLDRSGDVLVQPWSDARHAAELRQLFKNRGTTTVPLYAATLMAKYRWLQFQVPELAEKTSHLLYAKDFLLYRLTGSTVTDPASGPDAAHWPQAFMSENNIDESLFPRSQLPWTIAGDLTIQAAESLQCPVSLPVAVGAHDGICANTGAGAIDENQFAITLGTHSVVRAISMRHPAGALRFYGYPENKHIIGGNALMAGRSLDWFVDNWFTDAENERQAIFAELDTASAHILPGSNGVKFLPFLSGQMAPERRPGASAAFHGLKVNHTRNDMFRAVIEGSSFALCRIVNQVIDWVGEPKSIGLTGSGVKGVTWTQIIADTLQRPLGVTDASSEGRGAAMFLAVALGYYRNINEAAEVMVQQNHLIEPEPIMKSVYDELLGEWTRFSDVTRALDELQP
jgi:sugar (pentulose or hexulose) kinase